MKKNKGFVCEFCLRKKTKALFVNLFVWRLTLQHTHIHTHTQVYTVEESALAASNIPLQLVKSIAETACDAAQRLAFIGSGPASTRTHLNAKSEASVSASLRDVIQSLYTRFPNIRACVRRRLAKSVASAVSRCMHVPRAQLGVRLHALDGGIRASSITLTGAAASLEVGIVLYAHVYMCACLLCACMCLERSLGFDCMRWIEVYVHRVSV
jgi:hypothetical protein